MDKVKRDLYLRVFSTAEGKKVLRDLMQFGHVFDQVHVNGDPVSTAFNDGKRRMVLRILSFLKPQEMIDLYNNRQNVILGDNYDG